MSEIRDAPNRKLGRINALAGFAPHFRHSLGRHPLAGLGELRALFALGEKAAAQAA